MGRPTPGLSLEERMKMMMGGAAVEDGQASNSGKSHSNAIRDHSDAGIRSMGAAGLPPPSTPSHRDYNKHHNKGSKNQPAIMTRTITTTPPHHRKGHPHHQQMMGAEDTPTTVEITSDHSSNDGSGGGGGGGGFLRTPPPAISGSSNSNRVRPEEAGSRHYTYQLERNPYEHHIRNHQRKEQSLSRMKEIKARAATAADDDTKMNPENINRDRQRGVRRSKSADDADMMTPAVDSSSSYYEDHQANTGGIRSSSSSASSCSSNSNKKNKNKNKPKKKSDGKSSKHRYFPSNDMLPCSAEQQKRYNHPQDDEDEEMSESSLSVAPQPSSLACALGMMVDPSPKAPAIRKAPLAAALLFKPAPMTREEKRVDKERAMTRLERIKAKAIKSANKELGGIDQSRLANVMGVVNQTAANKSKANNSSKGKGASAETTIDETAQMQYLADTPGLPASFFGIKTPSKKAEAASSKTKIVAALPAMATKENVQQQASARRQAQAGSLAAALGMSVDTSSDKKHSAPAVCLENTANEGLQSGSKTKKSLLDSVFVASAAAATSTNSRANAASTGVTQQGHSAGDGRRPQPGSLAFALGMSVDSSRKAPPIRAAEHLASASASAPVFSNTAAAARRPPPPAFHDPPASTVSKSTHPAQAGSLAAALGMTVDLDRHSPAVRLEEHTNQKLHKTPGSKTKSLLDSVLVASATAATRPRIGTGFSPSQSDDDCQPQPGSLAFALGIQIDSSRKAPPIRAEQFASPSRPVVSLAAAAAAAQSPAASHLPVSTTGGHAAKQARAGSLAAALGMAVDSDRHSPPVRLENKNTNEIQPARTIKKSLLDSVVASAATASRPTATSGAVKSQQSDGQPQRGSLAFALGMSVDPSRRAPPVRVEPWPSSSAPPVFSNVTAAQQPPASTGHASSQARAGSLAAALGLTVDSDRHSPPVRLEKTIRAMHEPAGPMKKSLLDSVIVASACRLTATGSGPSHYNDDRPQPGSLAFALGMSIDPSRRAPPIRSSERQLTSISPAKKKSTVTEVAVFSGATAAHTTLPSTRPSISKQARAGSLAAALGMSVDSERHSPPVRLEKESGPVVRNMSSLDAISTARSAGLMQRNSNANGQPQPGSLAFALGMSVDTSRRAPAIRTEREPVGRNITMALAVLSSTAGVQSVYNGQNSRHAQAGSLASALGMWVDSNRHSPPVRLQKESSRPSQTQKSFIHSQSKSGAQPQSGSLAFALGMSVDDSRRAPPIRAEYHPASIAQKSILQAVDFSNAAAMHYGSGGSISQHARAGSLAAALGMSVDANRHSPPVRLEKESRHRGLSRSLGDAVVASSRTPTHQLSGYSQIPCDARPQPGSLAFALGMSVDTSRKAPPIRAEQLVSATKATKGNPKAQLPLEWDESSSGEDEEEAAPRILPQPGSLAEALGILIDPSSRAAFIRQKGCKAPPLKSFGNELSDRDFQDHSTRPPLYQPKGGLLATGFGVVAGFASCVPIVGHVMSSLQTPPRAVQFEASKDMLSLPSEGRFQSYSQAGRIDEALGYNIRRSARWPVSQQAGSIEDALCLGQASEQWINKEKTKSKKLQRRVEGASAVRFNPQAGSLAAALGMTIDPSSRASPVRQSSAFETREVNTKSTSCEASDEDVEADELPRFIPQPGSLAEALGMTVDPSSCAAPVREAKCASLQKVSDEEYRAHSFPAGPSMYPVDQATPRKNLFKTVFSKAAEASKPMSKGKNRVEIDAGASKNQNGNTRPQPGSLAEVLGMSVDSSLKAPALRTVDYSRVSPQTYLENTVKPLERSTTQKNHLHHTTIKSKKSLLDAVIINSGGRKTKLNNTRGIGQPHPGSLAAVLGMQVDLSAKSLPVRPAYTY